MNVEKSTNKKMSKLMMTKKTLKNMDLQTLSNHIAQTYQTFPQGRAAGLIRGGLLDLIIKEFFSHYDHYVQYDVGQADMKFHRIRFSLKTIYGKSLCALNWSKNPKEEEREFETHTMLIVYQTSQWWSKLTGYTDNILAGIYLCDKTFCNENITLDKNNKSNSIINSKALYSMIQHSIETKLFVPLPKPHENLQPLNISGLFN